MTFTVEYTDTFGGEANYSWVTRIDFEAPSNISQLALMRRAKRALGISGVRGRTSHFDGVTAFHPYNMCTVMFITYNY